MLIDDIRVGRWIRNTAEIVTFPQNTDTVIVPYDKTRVILKLITIGVVESFYAGLIAMTAAEQGAFIQSTGGMQIDLTLWDDGDLVQREWHLFSVQATPGVFVVTGQLPEEALRQCLCELKKK